MKFIVIVAFLFLCTTGSNAQNNILVLGIAQDGGYPHIGCQKECCNKAWAGESKSKMVTSLALVDHQSKQWWLLEATPDITKQLHLFDSLTQHQFPFLPNGIFITHAHIGHYTGLMQLGREALNANKVPVYVLPNMADFLRTNGPWNQLVSISNIEIHELTADSAVHLVKDFDVTPLLVPHRDEYSETCGFKIHANNMHYLFIPDINKWELWKRNILKEVGNVNIAFLDGTFNDSLELPGRNMRDIPHPFIEETLNVFSDNLLRDNIYFIHFNHSNRVMWDDVAKNKLIQRGCHLAEEGKWY